MKVKTNVKAGGINLANHNQTVKGLRVKSNVKAEMVKAFLDSFEYRRRFA